MTASQPRVGDERWRLARRQYWLRIFFIISLATILVATASGAFNAPLRLRDLVGTIVAAFVYCSCIGGLCGLVMPHVVHRLRTIRFPLNWAAIVGVLLAINGAGCLMAMLGLMAIGVAEPVSLARFPGAFWESYRIGVFFTLVFGIGGTLYQTLYAELEDTSEALRARQREEERARQAATEARLSSLESRVRPHFLFNTLNSISALVHDDPDRAERLIEHLSALLRSSLDTSEQPTIPLTDELRLVRDYLDIERTRFGDRVRYTIDVPDSIGSVAVPPFSIQPLVENAVKHAVSPQRAGAAVRIQARRERETLVVSVSDDGPGFTEVMLVPGHGLHTLQARLEALFGWNARLDVARHDGWTIVTMTLPLHVPVPSTA